MRKSFYGSQESIVQYRDIAGETADPARLALWPRGGIRYLPKFMPEPLMDAYSALRGQVEPAGWVYPTPYLHYRELRDLCLYPPLLAECEKLVGEPVGLHLNLTGWVSTERDFHQDTYLNPPEVGDFYLAAWIALEDIDPDSGPFQFIPDSHRWPAIAREKVIEKAGAAVAADPAWPGITQNWVARACLEEALVRNSRIQTHLPKRGDVLLWHANLVHRGSPPNVRGTPRRACIAHYSGVKHRPDMVFEVDGPTGGHFARFNHEPKAEYPAPTVR